jgi:hypothetical protein
LQFRHYSAVLRRLQLHLRPATVFFIVKGQGAGLKQEHVLFLPKPAGICYEPLKPQ